MSHNYSTAYNIFLCLKQVVNFKILSDFTLMFLILKKQITLFNRYQLICKNMKNTDVPYMLNYGFAMFAY